MTWRTFLRSSGKRTSRKRILYAQMMRCFSVCLCSHDGHLYVTSAYSNPYSRAMCGMKSCKTNANVLNSFHPQTALCGLKKRAWNESSRSVFGLVYVEKTKLLGASQLVLLPYAVLLLQHFDVQYLRIKTIYQAYRVS